MEQFTSNSPAQVPRYHYRGYMNIVQRQLLFNSLPEPCLAKIYDPYVQTFQDDPTVLVLKSDPSLLSRGYWKGYGLFSLFCPFCIPSQLLLGTPCAIYASRNLISTLAEAATMVLHESTIVYRIRTTEIPLAEPGAPFFPLCQAFRGQKIRGLEICIPLDDDVQLDLVPESYSMMSKDWFGANTLVVKSQGRCVACIDAPADVHNFLNEAQRRINHAKRTKPSSLISQATKLHHEAFLKLLSEVSIDGVLTWKPSEDSPERMSGNAAIRIQQHFLKKYYVYHEKLSPANIENVDVAPRAPVTAEMKRDDALAKFSGLTANDIANLLTNDLSLQRYSEQFEQAHIDGKRFLKLNDQMLLELGVSSLQDRRKILEWILSNAGTSSSEIPQA
jgi:hypothetical protein